MQVKTETYSPEWISEAKACEWLGVHRTTLIRWRSEKGIGWTSINGRSVMYDKKSLDQLLFDNSTYNFQDKKATA